MSTGTAVTFNRSGISSRNSAVSGHGAKYPGVYFIYCDNKFEHDSISTGSIKHSASRRPTCARKNHTKTNSRHQQTVSATVTVGEYSSSSSSSSSKRNKETHWIGKQAR